MRENDPGDDWDLIDGEDDGALFRYTYQSVVTGEIRTYVVEVDGDHVTAREETS
jgi:hypothetical protein